MSGIFWEQDRQPNLCEAASGFTFSTINLLVAVPMAALDLLVTGLLAVWSLAAGLLLPLLEVTQSSLTALAELLGLTEMPAVADLVPTGLAALLLAHIFMEQRQGASGHQLASKYSLVSTGLLWLAAIYAAPDFAAAPRFVAVALALSVASYLPSLLVAMVANFRPTPTAATNSLQEAAAGLSSLLSMEAALVVVVAAYGGPDLSGSSNVNDEVFGLTQYFCAVPLCACLLVYTTLRRPGPLAEGDNPPHATAMNGSAVPVQETTAEPEVAAAVEPPTAVQATDPAEDSPPPEHVETVGAVEEGAAVTAEAETISVEEKATPEETPAPPAAEPIKVDETDAAVVATEATTTSAAETKEDVLLAKLKSRLCGLVGSCYGRLAAFVGLLALTAGQWTAAVGRLPWFQIDLALSKGGSHVLAALAWNVLTASQLAFLLPVFTLVLPALLDRYNMCMQWDSLMGWGRF
jgi:hypothetical protein